MAETINILFVTPKRATRLYGVHDIHVPVTKGKIVMATKNTTGYSEPKVAKYVVKGPKAKATKTCTLSIRRVPIDDLEREIESVMKLAIDDGKKFNFIRGTLTCY